MGNYYDGCEYFGAGGGTVVGDGSICGDCGGFQISYADLTKMQGQQIKRGKFLSCGAISSHNQATWGAILS